MVREFWTRPNNTAASALVPAFTGLNETDFEKQFETVLHDGLFKGSAAKPITPKVNMARATAAPANPTPASQNLDIAFLPDPTVYDGRFTNNAWLQSLPKPITKLAWDNAALISPATAIRLGFAPPGNMERAFEANEKMVEIKVGQNSLKAALTVIPGHADDAITLHLG